VLPHGHAGQQHFVARTGLLELPHGLCPLDLLALHGAPVVVFVIVRRIRLPGQRVSVAAKRRQVADARALPHGRRAGVPPASVHAAAAAATAVVRRLHRSR